MEYDMFDEREHVTEQEISLRLKSSLFCESFGYMYRIKFSNKIMTDSVRTKGDQNRCYELVQ